MAQNRRLEHAKLNVRRFTLIWFLGSVQGWTTDSFFFFLVNGNLLLVCVGHRNLFSWMCGLVENALSEAFVGWARSSRLSAYPQDQYGGGFFYDKGEQLDDVCAALPVWPCQLSPKLCPLGRYSGLRDWAPETNVMIFLSESCREIAKTRTRNEEPRERENKTKEKRDSVTDYYVLICKSVFVWKFQKD